MLQMPEVLFWRYAGLHAGHVVRERHRQERLDVQGVHYGGLRLRQKDVRQAWKLIRGLEMHVLLLHRPFLLRRRLWTLLHTLSQRCYER